MAPIYVGMLEGDIYLYSNLEKENMKGRNRTQTFGRGKSKENFTKNCEKRIIFIKIFMRKYLLVYTPFPNGLFLLKTYLKLTY